MQQQAMDATKTALQFLEKREDDSVPSEELSSQMAHRIQFVEKWGIGKGARVLEIGCGQGDCTVVLAEAVGQEGHVDAVDPGALDYGAPTTLGEAQAHISSGKYGSRITFHNASPLTYLSAYTGPPYDYVVLAHCIWYFETPSILDSIVRAAASHTRNLCLAEWSLRATYPTSQPHVLAALLLSSLESKRLIPSSGNIRTVLSPSQITSIIDSTSAFKLARQEILESNAGLEDGFWEVGYALRSREKKLAVLKGDGVGEKEVAVMESMFDSLQASVAILEEGVKSVRSMDVWVAKFEVV